MKPILAILLNLLIGTSLFAQNNMEYAVHMNICGSLDNLYLVNKSDSIFRSKQPNYEDFKLLRQEYNIQSILKLDTEKIEDYRDIKFNINTVAMPWETVSELQVLAALQFLKQAPKPLLVHCAAGVDRTGIVIALYRVLFNSWPKDSALAEMKGTEGWEHGYLHDKTNPDLINYYDTVDVYRLKKQVQKEIQNSVTVDNIDLNDYFNNPVEISGIVNYKNLFYLVEEKRKKITVLNDKYEITNTIDLSQKGLKDVGVELEGVAIYKNHFLITNERKDSVKLFDYNIDKDIVSSIAPLYVSNDSGSFGIEGIAVNEAKSICYILKERNEKYQSVIKEYNIDIHRKKINLQFKDSIVIQHKIEAGKTPEQNWRYSDIFYGTDNKLFCLKTFYNGNDSKYQTDILSLNDSGYVEKKFIESNADNNFIDISEKINTYNSYNYSTNLEGITIYNSEIYLISDNCDCPNGTTRKTLFIKFPIRNL